VVTSCSGDEAQAWFEALSRAVVHPARRFDVRTRTVPEDGLEGSR
jgi:hypothetical protein